MTRRELVKALEPTDDEVLVHDPGVREPFPVEVVTQRQADTEPGIAVCVEK